MRIGHGAIVAAGAVVPRDVAPYSVVAGNPARHVRWRFDEPLREQLLATVWWDWPVDELCTLGELLCSDDIKAFLAYAATRSSTP